MALLVALAAALALWIVGHVTFTAMDTYYTPGHWAGCWRCRMFGLPDPEAGEQPEGGDR